MFNNTPRAKYRSVNMSKKKTYKPGQKAPASAQYGIIGPRGGEVPGEVTGVKGNTLPPTPKPGQKYIIRDRTDNNSGKGK
jgi:hypothetical protein